MFQYVDSLKEIDEFKMKFYFTIGANNCLTDIVSVSVLNFHKD